MSSSSKSNSMNSGSIFSTTISDEVNSDYTTTPKDRYNFVYLTAVLQGIAILIPWNVFITATSYFVKYKLSIHLENGTQFDTKYKDYYLNNVALCSNIPNVLISVMLIFLQSKVVSINPSTLNNRVYISLSSEIILLIFTIILAYLDTSNWTGLFVIATMVTVVLINIASAAFQNSVYALISKLPMKYTNAVVLGNNVCGTFISLANIFTLWTATDIRDAAIGYFTIATLVLIFTIVTFVILNSNSFYCQYLNVQIESKYKIQKNDPVPYWNIFKSIWNQCLNVFLVFVVTLATFPAIQSNIYPMNPEIFNSIDSTSTYFVPVCCFLLFNVFAMFGNIIPNYIIFPKPKYFWIPILARFLFIPFFLYSNYNPDKRKLPILFKSDTLLIIFSIIFALTSGYYSSLAMMHIPKSIYDPRYVSIAAMIGSSSLQIGVLTGVYVSYLLVWITYK